jgi:hypothetical protein
MGGALFDVTATERLIPRESFARSRDSTAGASPAKFDWQLERLPFNGLATRPFRGNKSWMYNSGLGRQTVAFENRKALKRKKSS